ncbi:MAG TPA: OmpA family protein [Bacteroidia bacterium]|jgi:OOP family OmpA-OmpF porin|nr:OmpA family protein [Bacteroidia bacterium]
MKLWLLFPALVIFSPLGIAQDLQPDDTNALLNVSVIDYLKRPMSGEKISFNSKINHKEYSGITDSLGKFHLLIPKDADYDVKYTQFTSEAAYDNTLTIPKGEDQLLTFNYTVRVKLPEKYTLNNVFFDFNKAILTTESFKALNQLTSFMKAQKTMVIEIAGYTDNVGTEEANQRLSQERADAIRDYLLRHGVHARKIEAKGYGSIDPIATNDTQEGRKLNRRTEIHILKQ